MAYIEVLIISLVTCAATIVTGVVVHNVTDSPIMIYGFWCVAACIAYLIIETNWKCIKLIMVDIREREQLDADLKKALRYLQGRSSSRFAHLVGLMPGGAPDCDIDAVVEGLDRKKASAALTIAHGHIKDHKAEQSQKDAANA